MPDLFSQRDFWKPLQKFQDPKAYEDFDMAVKAYIQIDMTNYLVKNMPDYLQEQGLFEELQDFVKRWNLSHVILQEYHIHKLGLSLKQFTNLYDLEKELWKNFANIGQPWAVEQLCRSYRHDLEELISRHLTRNHHAVIPQVLSRSARFTQLISKARSYKTRNRSLFDQRTQNTSLMTRIKKFFMHFGALS